MVFSLPCRYVDCYAYYGVSIMKEDKNVERLLKGYVAHEKIAVTVKKILKQKIKKGEQ